MRGAFLLKRVDKGMISFCVCGLNVQSNNFVLFKKKLIRFETAPDLKIDTKLNTKLNDSLLGKLIRYL